MNGEQIRLDKFGWDCLFHSTILTYAWSESNYNKPLHDSW